MKNRLQFNRIPKLFHSGGTQNEGRVQATEAIKTYISGETFIPLIGEPILARYVDDKGEKQPLIAIGVATGNGAEYRIIDPARFREGLDAAFSGIAATNVWFNGRCDVLQGQCVNIQNQLNDEKGYRKCIKLLEVRREDYESLNLGDDVKDAYFLTRHLPNSTTEYYVTPQSGDVIIKVYKNTVNPEDIEALSASVQTLATEIYEYVDTLSGDILTYIYDNEEVTAAALNDLNGRVSTNSGSIIDNRNSISNLSGAVETVISSIESLSSTTIETSEKLYQLSAATVHDLNDLSNAILVVSGDVAECFNFAKYESSAKTIDFYHDGVVKCSIDATNFIKDGMVSAVTTDTPSAGTHSGETCLIITFNTDAGKEDIEIPLSEIFDPALLDELSASVVDNRTYIEFLSGVVEDNELITAAALNDLNGRLKEGKEELENYVDGQISTVQTNIEFLSGVVKDNELVTAAALNDLNSRINNSTAEIEDYINYVKDNEEVTAGALNDLNERVATVETRMSGDYIYLTNYEISEGTTEEELIIDEDDSVNEAFGKIQKQIIDNEESISAGLNDLNRRVTENTEAIAENTGVTELSGAVISLCAETMNLSSATYNTFSNINNQFNNVETDIENLSSATISIENLLDELSGATISVSGALESISAKTNGTLTVNVNGSEQGRYCPSANTTLDLEIIQEVTGADVLLTGYELSSGVTEEELVVLATDTVNEAFGKIQKQIYDNEVVMSTALNDINSRIIELGTQSEDNELVVASALNNLNNRMVELSGQTAYRSEYYTKTQVDAVVKKKFAETTDITNLTFDEFLTVITLAGDNNLTVTSNPTWNIEIGEVIEGRVIVQNTGLTGITVTLPTGDNRVKIVGDNVLIVDPNGFGEINVMITKTGTDTYVIYLINHS